MGTDEGRAMMQIVHDVAPGAAQAFHTAFNGLADFANGILELKTAAGADVIVDDVIYPEEPMFADGAVAQAVDQVKAMGVPYFSAAGNSAQDSYESAFRPSGEQVTIVDEFGNLLLNGELHDFDPGSGVDLLQRITAPFGTQVVLSLQWDQPYFSVSGLPGSTSDIEICVTDNPPDGIPTAVFACSFVDNLNNDPVDVLTYLNFDFFSINSDFALMILNNGNLPGPNPGLMKYVWFNGGATINEYQMSTSTTYGHANAAGAEAVGAAFYRETPEFGQTPPLLEDFSSAGGTPILFNSSGARLLTPEVRAKPEIVAPDGTDTSFFPPPELFGNTDVDSSGFPNFFGTSAAAPHAAGVAALILDKNSALLPDDVYRSLEITAIDMGPVGFDFKSGLGFIRADAALNVVVPEPPPIPKLHVGDLDGSFTSNSRSWRASVAIAVHNNANHGSLKGAIVTGNWSSNGVTVASSSCTTGNNGRCTVQSPRLSSSSSSAAFAVQGVSLSGYNYDSGSNHDPDVGETHPTSSSITVTKP